MPRIPKTELERLKREVSLERLVEAKGIKLERHGQDLIGLCPFHPDKSPSLVVSLCLANCWSRRHRKHEEPSAVRFPPVVVE